MMTSTFWETSLLVLIATSSFENDSPSRPPPRAHIPGFSCMSFLARRSVYSSSSSFREPLLLKMSGRVRSRSAWASLICALNRGDPPSEQQPLLPQSGRVGRVQLEAAAGVGVGVAAGVAVGVGLEVEPPLAEPVGLA